MASSASIIGKLGNTKTKVVIDIGVGDAVKPTEITMKLLETDKAPLFEKEIHIWAYPVESIFAEKLETAISRLDQNSRMKDYHDLVVLIRSDVLNKERVKAAVNDTFTNRETTVQELAIPKELLSTIQNYWDLYLRALMPEVREQLNNDLQIVIDEINSYLQKVWR